MPEFSILGLSSGTTSFTVADADSSETASLDIVGNTTPTEKCVKYLTGETSTTAWQGLSTCPAADDHYNQLAFGFTPPVHRFVGIVTQSHANKLYLNFSELSVFEQMNPAAYYTGEAHIYRVTNGVMDRVDVGTLNGGKAGRWAKPYGQDEFVTQPNYEWRTNSQYLEGVNYPFRVRAIDANGEYGPWSEIEFLLQAAGNGRAAVNAAPTTPPNLTGLSSNLTAPASFAAAPIPAEPFLINLTWTPVANAVAYQIQSSFQDRQDIVADDDEPYFNVSGLSGSIEAGDMVVLYSENLNFTQNIASRRVKALNRFLGHKLFSNVSGNVSPNQTLEFKRFTALDPNPDDTDVGAHYLTRNCAPNESSLDGYAYSGGSGQGYYPVLRAGENYNFEVWVRANNSEGQITIDFDQVGVAIATITPTTEWVKHVVPINPTATDTTNRAIFIDITLNSGASGTSFDFAGLRFYNAALPAFANPLNDDVPDNVWLRDHVNIKKVGGLNIGTHIDDFLGPTGNGVKGANAETHLNNCVAANNLPWFQFEIYHTKAEWEKILEWLADNLGAYSKFRVEIGNESWQSHPSFWKIFSMTDASTGSFYERGDVYGLFCRMVYRWFSEHPRWSEVSEKIDFYIGGRSVTAFGARAYKYFPEAKSGGGAFYNGGWDNGSPLVQETGQDIQNMLHTPFAVQRNFAMARELEYKLEAEAHGKIFGVDFIVDQYEMMQGFALSKTTEEEIVENLVMKSRAGATSVVDLFLSNAIRGAGTTFFALGTGGGFSSHVADGDGGQTNACYTLLKSLSDAIGPSYGATLQDVRTPNSDVSTIVFGNQVTPSIFVYALKSRDNSGDWLLAIGNRLINPSTLSAEDPMYDASETGQIDIAIATNWVTASSMSVCRNLGNMREHFNHPVGTRRLATGEFVPDPLCVELTYPFENEQLPSNLEMISIDDIPGVSPGGLLGGECILLKFEGVVERS